MIIERELMAEIRTIACEDCGHPYETTRPNTKYDSVCRLLRDLKFVGSRTRRCLWCGESYAPLNRNDDRCADCAYQPKAPGSCPCAFCGEERLRAVRDVAVCHWCARDPELRLKFLGSLTRKRRARVAA
jgi:hypothetical protein